MEHSDHDTTTPPGESSCKLVKTFTHLVDPVASITTTLQCRGGHPWPSSGSPSHGQARAFNPGQIVPDSVEAWWDYSGQGLVVRAERSTRARTPAVLGAQATLVRRRNSQTRSGQPFRPPSGHTLRTAGQRALRSQDSCGTDTLDQAVVGDYLPASASPERAAQWQPVIQAMHDAPDGPLARAMGSPLTAWLTRTVYANSKHNPAELLSFTDQATLEKHLANALIPAVYAQDPRPRPWPARPRRPRRESAGSCRHAHPVRATTRSRPRCPAEDASPADHPADDWPAPAATALPPPSQHQTNLTDTAARAPSVTPWPIPPSRLTSRRPRSQNTLSALKGCYRCGWPYPMVRPAMEEGHGHAVVVLKM